MFPCPQEKGEKDSRKKQVQVAPELIKYEGSYRKGVVGV
jgi:hypothetical protein